MPTTDKVEKYSEEVSKLEQKLKAAKDKERKARQVAAKKAKAKRSGWLVLLAEVVLKKEDWSPERFQSLLRDAENQLSAANFKKLKEGLESEGFLNGLGD